MPELQLSLDPTSKTPLYKQLADTIEESIFSAVLKGGDRLPPTRDLALRLGTARRTVIRAYGELLNKGLIECKTGAGTVVSSHMLSKPMTAFPSPDLLSMLSPSVRKSMNHDDYSDIDDSHLVPTLLCGDLLPVKTWCQLLLGDFMPEEPRIFSTSAQASYRALQQCLTQFLIRTKGLYCQPTQVLICSGPAQALDLVAKLIIEENDTVMLENPCSPSIRQFFQSSGAQIVHVPIDSEGVRTDVFGTEGYSRNSAKLLYVSPSCQDPTGIVMSAERQKQLIDWARKNNAILVESGFDSDFRFGSHRIASIQGLAEERTIYLYSFHKLLSPLSSLSAVVLPSQLVPAAERLLSRTRSNDALHYRILSAFIQEGHLDNYVSKLKKIFQERRQVLLFSLTTGLRQAISIAPSVAGTNAVFRLAPEFGEEFVLGCAEQSELTIKCLRESYSSDCSFNEFSIPFSSLDTEQIRARVGLFSTLLARNPDVSTLSRSEVREVNAPSETNYSVPNHANLSNRVVLPSQGRL